MEEDIKILEKIKQGFIADTKAPNVAIRNIAIRKVQAIENLIARNKELEESHGTAYNAGKAFKQHQWKEKITKLLEKLDKEEQDLQNSISDEEREEYSDANISYQLMEIEIRKSVLQELLKN